MKSCIKCNGYLSDRWKWPDCYDCQQFKDNTDEVDHETDIRCPKCGYQMNVADTEHYGLMSEGDHQAWCCECGHSFQVNTSVSYTFYSPARIESEEDES